ncbi:MAG: xanthine dehydrogenase family protein subunit M [Pseudonocardia sp.]
MKPAAFDYLAPRTIDEALAQLAEHGAEARPLAGGQSLVRLMNQRAATPSVIVDLNRLPDLDHVASDNGTVRIGALARQRGVETSDVVRSRIPLLAEAGAQVAHLAVRERGTVVGSVAFADPSAELPAALLALDGQVVAQSVGGERVLDAEAFFTGPFTTALDPDELAVELRIPALPQERCGSAFVEMARRHGDLPVCGVAAVVRLDSEDRIGSARIALCGVDRRPVRATEAEDALAGRQPTDELLREAAAIASWNVDPAGDCHGSAEFRRHLAGVLTRRALATSISRAVDAAREDGNA